MSFIKAISIGAAGAVLLAHALYAMTSGAIGLVNKRGYERMVTFADSPFLFVVCMGLMLFIGFGALYVVKRGLAGKNDL